MRSWGGGERTGRDMTGKGERDDRGDKGGGAGEGHCCW